MNRITWSAACTAVRMAACIALASGCALGGTSPPPRFFVLEATAEAASTAACPVHLGVGPVEVARYADRPQLVTRDGDGVLDLDDSAHWGERLDAMIARTLAEDLVRITGSPHVFVHPWPSAQLEHRVFVRVLRFDTDPGGRAHLVAQWQLAADTAPDRATTFRTDVELAAADGGPTARVAALSELVEALAREIAGALPVNPAGCADAGRAGETESRSQLP